MRFMQGIYKGQDGSRRVGIIDARPLVQNDG